MPGSAFVSSMEGLVGLKYNESCLLCVRVFIKALFVVQVKHLISFLAIVNREILLQKSPCDTLVDSVCCGRHQGGFGALEKVLEDARCCSGSVQAVGALHPPGKRWAEVLVGKWAMKLLLMLLLSEWIPGYV